MSDLKERILKAHGGSDSWRQVSQVLACVSMGGLEFLSRLNPAPLKDVEVAVSTREPAVTFADFPVSGQTGQFRQDRVWIETGDGACVMERRSPVEGFRSFRRWLVWDQLDVLFYSGVLLWHSVNLPFTLLGRDIVGEELPTRDFDGVRCRRLSLCCHGEPLLPDGEHVLFAESGGLVRRVDSAAPMPGSPFRMAQIWERPESVDGLVLSTLRRFQAALAGQTWSMANLAWVEMRDLSLVKMPVSAADNRRTAVGS